MSHRPSWFWIFRIGSFMPWRCNPPFPVGGKGKTGEDIVVFEFRIFLQYPFDGHSTRHPLEHIVNGYAHIADTGLASAPFFVLSAYFAPRGADTKDSVLPARIDYIFDTLDPEHHVFEGEMVLLGIEMDFYQIFSFFINMASISAKYSLHRLPSISLASSWNLSLKEFVNKGIFPSR